MMQTSKLTCAIHLLPLLLLFLLFGAPCHGSSNAARKIATTETCTPESRRRVDLSILKIMSLGEHGRDFPTNAKELQHYCRESVELIDRVEGYINRCFTTDIRDLAKMIFFSVKSVERKFCRRKLSNAGKRLRTLVATGPCLNKYARHNTSCIDTYVHDLEQIIFLPTELDKLKIPYACCRYSAMTDCISDFLDTHPCMERNKGLIMDFVRGFVQALVDVMCGEYNDQSDRCDSIPPLPPVQLPPNRPQYLSMMFPLIDMFQSIKKEDRTIL